jgi:hypothetical protein
MPTMAAGMLGAVSSTAPAWSAGALAALCLALIRRRCPLRLKPAWIHSWGAMVASRVTNFSGQRGTLRGENSWTMESTQHRVSLMSTALPRRAMRVRSKASTA